MRPKCSPNNLVRLIVGGALVVAGWTIVLPALSAQHAMRQRLDRRKEQDINADAMFYTELKAMPEVTERMERLHAQHNRVFWQVSE